MAQEQLQLLQQLPSGGGVVLGIPLPRLHLQYHHQHHNDDYDQQDDDGNTAPLALVLLQCLGFHKCLGAATYIVCGSGHLHHSSATRTEHTPWRLCCPMMWLVSDQLSTEHPRRLYKYKQWDTYRFT
eukprot:GHUV01032812.1.p1 GENE.GHUV01032812.1~~GHUV01032812.1.p1  ORF type:complete len:135 (-),score=22.58 GHUV01032812.1:386-766(-)